MTPQDQIEQWGWEHEGDYPEPMTNETKEAYLKWFHVRFGLDIKQEGDYLNFYRKDKGYQLASKDLRDNKIYIDDETFSDYIRNLIDEQYFWNLEEKSMRQFDDYGEPFGPKWFRVTICYRDNHKSWIGADDIDALTRFEALAFGLYETLKTDRYDDFNTRKEVDNAS